MGRNHELRSHLDVLKLWDGPTALARDLGVEPVVVRMWLYRGRVPPHRWAALAATPLGREYGVSVELLARMLSEPAAAA